MNTGRWQKLDSIFHAARLLHAAERDLYVSRHCGDDTELKLEIESLLASHEVGDDAFLKTGGFAAGVKLLDEPAAPARIGIYKIGREIGRGGFGAVYLAEREGEFSQKVALKIIKRGMDTDEIIRRFRQERQVLASLNHPFITRLLDGATTPDGLPYLVMEYVEGTALDDHCRNGKPSLDERFELFRKICAAVSYAHQNLVVHRDLKPSNILITSGGEPKLLDFGIARILSDDDSETRATTRIFTPEYAAPEQRRGERVTTATDIYSLGILLSHLVNGPGFPEDSHGASGYRRYFANWFSGVNSDSGMSAGKMGEGHHPPVAGDIGTIIQMATREDPGRRYASVSDLSEDIRRHMRGLPVLARKDTFSYRAEKFVRRHLAGVTAAAVVLAALIGGLSISLWQASVARAEREKAERRFRDVRTLTNSFLFEFHDAIKDTAGTLPARRLVVSKALEYLGKLSGEDENDLQLLGELAEAYVRVGAAQADSLRETENSLKSFQTAAEIDRRILKLDPGDAKTKKRLVTDLFKCAETLSALGRISEAVAIDRESSALHEEIAGLEPENMGLINDLAEARQHTGEMLLRLDEPDQAEKMFREALQTIAGRIAVDDTASTGLSFAWIIRGELLGQLKDLSGSAESYTRAAEIAEIASAADPNDAQARRNLSASHNRAGDALDAMKDFDGALRQFSTSLDLIKRQVSVNPSDAQLRTAEAYYTVKVAIETEKTGDKARALRLVREGLALREKLSAEDTSRGTGWYYHAGLFEDGGDLLQKLGQRREARALYEKTLIIYSRLVAEDAENADIRDGRNRVQAKIDRL